MKKAHLATVLILAAIGCDKERHEDARPVPFDQVPPKIVEVARKKLPGIEFNQAFKIDGDGQEIYEVRGKDKRGKIREVEVSRDGEVIEVE